ncbi:TonB-dependent receptor [Sphingomonas sp. BT-65]|uniref:TonB-dependent receptor n=1 Tax=Sphingomonas sp. BT-65 TaxID=2989821 RepID=UPI002235962B|nr:TonB-dependent receptor [Sphingomonas sp. BT-65]MCW4461523.1 TonB-dependent receptor [Sphingomonas sp. BT-65]
MTRTTFDGGKAAPVFLALAAVGFIASAPALAADPAAGPDDQDRRDDVVVTGQEVKSEQESPKATRPVRDTPQSVTIITNKTIEEQNLLTLRDVLSTVPGITFGAGEGGGGYGDSINFRGYSANTDITVDGVRDSAQYSRTDPFNLEQLEVVNGANSVTAGAGSVGGSINIVTKSPLAEDQVIVTGGIGTDDYYRGTLDANVRTGDKVAFRLNAMVHKNDVPGRDVEKYDRWGVAPSVTLGIGGPTRLTLKYFHQEDINTPQYGVPYYQTATNAGALPGVDPSDYFGYRNIDRQETNVDQATIVFEHDFSDDVSIRNLTRWQDVRQHALVNPPQGTWCLASGVTPTGGSCVVDLDTRTGVGQVFNITVPAGYYLPSGPRGTTRITRNQLMYNQTDLSAEFATGGLRHTLVLGISAAWEQFNLSNGNSLRAANGSNPVEFNPAAPNAAAHLPYINIANPNEIVPGPAVPGAVYGSNVYTGPLNYIESGRQRGEVTNYAIYLFDTIAFSKQLELNLGVRYERNEGKHRSDTVSTAGVVTPGVPVENADNLFSYRAGLVFKPVEAVSLYAAYGNSKTPSKTSVNGSCTVDTCNVKPETAVNYEIGAKAEIMGGRLLLTAAAFRNERTNYKVPSADPLIPEQQLDGESRVNGIALGAVGQITPAWSITANYTYLDSEVIRSVATNGAGPIPDPQAGNPLVQTPRHSGSLFTVYALPFGLKIGYGFTYQGSFYLNNNAATLFKAEDYMIHNAFLAYDFTPNLTAQVNVKNFTDEEYYTRVRNNGWATPGEGRAAVLTIGYRF